MVRILVVLHHLNVFVKIKKKMVSVRWNSAISWHDLCIPWKISRSIHRNWYEDAETIVRLHEKKSVPLLLRCFRLVLDLKMVIIVLASSYWNQLKISQEKINKRWFFSNISHKLHINMKHGSQKDNYRHWTEGRIIGVFLCMCVCL